MSDKLDSVSIIADDAGNITDGQVPEWAVRLDSAMKAQRIGNTELGDLASIDRRRIHGYRIGKSEPSATAAFAIAQALGTTVEYLMTGEGGPPPQLPRIGAMITPELAERARLAGQGIGDATRQAIAEAAPDAFDVSAKLPPNAYDRAAITLDRAVRLARHEPSEQVRIALMQILFRHAIDPESIALLLEALAPDDPAS